MGGFAIVLVGVVILIMILARHLVSEKGVVAAIVGMLLGGTVAFLLRPSAPLIGQLPFDKVITRGAFLEGLDRLLIPTAQTSFNYLIVGLIVGGVLGATIMYLDAMRKKQNNAASQPKEAPRLPKPNTVELGQSPAQVESALGKPDQIINLAQKSIYVYPNLKVIFIDGKVSDVQ
jgi:hypothetical protein